MRKLLTVVVAAIISFGVVACDGEDQGTDTRDEQSEQVGEMMAEAQNQVGMPEITQFFERQTVKRIMELRDREIATFTYIVDWQGRLHHLCASIGYGVPYSTQMTSPEKWVDIDGDHNGARDKKVPQAEPNGLYMPNNVSATWILCQMEGSDETTPVYSEPALIVSPEPLNAVDTYQPGGEQ